MRRYIYEYKPTMVTLKVTDNMEKEVAVFRNGLGKILSKKMAMEIINELLNFYDGNIENLDEVISKHNKDQRLAVYGFPYDAEKDLYLLPDPYIDRRKIRENLKTDWGFTCKWCGKKWSSKTEKYYYVASFNPMGGAGNNVEMACSKICSTHIHNELAKSWIYKKGYAEYFSI